MSAINWHDVHAEQVAIVLVINLSFSQYSFFITIFLEAMASLEVTISLSNSVNSVSQVFDQDHSKHKQEINSGPRYEPRPCFGKLCA